MDGGVRLTQAIRVGIRTVRSAAVPESEPARGEGAFPWSDAEQTLELRPAEPPFEDLLGRIIRITVEGESLVGHGWGGRRVAVPLAAVRTIELVHTRPYQPKVERPAVEGLLVLDRDRRALLRVTGTWNPEEVRAFARRHKLRARYESSRRRDQSTAAPPRTAGCPVLHCQSRLLWLWRLSHALVPTAVGVAMFAVLLGVADSHPVIGMTLVVFLPIATLLIIKRLPEWIRALTRPLAIRRQPIRSADHHSQVVAARIEATRAAPGGNKPHSKVSRRRRRKRRR